MKRVYVDARRADKGGISRVTNALVSALAKSQSFETTAIRLSGMPHPAEVEGIEELASLKILEVEHPQLSQGDMTELPKLLSSCDFDLFIAPQFYAPLGLNMPVVGWVHDVWPLTHPEWLPSLDSLSVKHGAHARESGERILATFRSMRERGNLFPGNAFLADVENNRTGVAAWNAAMFAMNLARCAQIVTCSNTSLAALTSLFPEIAPRTDVILNPMPRGIPLLPSTAESPRLLHVSKWEPRKNLPGGCAG